MTAELLLGRTPRTRLDLLKPNTAEHVERNQWQQKQHHDSTDKERMFEEKEDIFTRDYGLGAKWTPGVIEKQIGHVSFLVKFTDGHLCHCHQDQV